MKRRTVRKALVIAAVFLLLYGVFDEVHRVYSLQRETARAVSGSGFIEATTVDGLLRRDGRLYDVYSLTPDTASVKDCKT